MNKSLVGWIFFNICMTVLTIACNQDTDKDLCSISGVKSNHCCIPVNECVKPKSPLYAFCYYKPPLGTNIMLFPSYTFLFDQPSKASGIDVSNAATTGSIRILHKGLYKITYMLVINTTESVAEEDTVIGVGIYVNGSLSESTTAYLFERAVIRAPEDVRNIEAQCIVKLSKNDTLSLKVIEEQHTHLLQNSVEPPLVLASITIESIF